MRFAGLLLLVCFNVLSALAHGDLHARIEILSTRIKQAPQDLELYRQRGELLLQHEEYARAKRDLERCRRHGNKSQKLYYCLAKTYFHLRKFKRCKLYLHLSLDELPEDTKSHCLLARCHLAMEEFSQAINEYGKWKEYSIRPRPKIYLELANAYFLNGDIDMSIHTLQSAILQLGMLPTLSTKLLDYFKICQDYQSAIELQTEVIRVCARKEFALLERALLFEVQNKQEASQADLIAATLCIEKLPVHVRKGPRIKGLANRIEELMTKMKSPKHD